MLATGPWAIVTAASTRATFVNVAADPVTLNLAAEAAVEALMSANTVTVVRYTCASLQVWFWGSEHLAAKHK